MAAETCLAAHNLDVNLVDVRDRIGKFDIRSTPGSQDVLYSHVLRSSVLVPLFFRNGELRVLLTVRSPNLRHHASMVAFPGGRKDAGDKNDAETALREAEEEVGLSPSQVEVIGYLAPAFARPAYAVFPVVGFIPEDFQPQPNQSEVTLVFSVPLARFLGEDCETRDFEHAGNKVKIYYFECDTVEGPLNVWGVTAWICMMVAGIVFQQDPMKLITGGYGPPEDVIKSFNEHFILMCEITKPAKL